MEKCLCDKFDERKPGVNIIISNPTAAEREKSTAEPTNLQKTNLTLRS